MLYKLRLRISDTFRNIIISLLFPPKMMWKVLRSGVLVGNARTTGTIQLQNNANILENIDNFNLAYTKDHTGEYLAASLIRKSTIEKIYTDAKVSDQYFPPLIGTRWTSHIGHLAVLALHSKGQEMGILPEGKRYVLDYQNIANQALFELFSDEYESLSDSYLSQLEFFPPAQLLFENFHAIKTNQGILETHAFIEKIFSTHNDMFPNNTILSTKLAEEIVSSRNISKFNLKHDEKFVVVHLRNTGQGERRDVDVSTYKKAFLLLKQEGFRIINIGPEIEDNNSVVIHNVLDRNMHPYLISKAEFTITTSSGPALIPGLFGVPNLTTNLTSIGRTMISSNAESYSLPKGISVDGRILNFREILNSSMGYDERERKDLDKLGIKLLDNSSEEIFRAVEWMIHRKLMANMNLDREFFHQTQKIQEETQAVTFGKVVPSYLQAHPEYLDEFN